MICLAKTAVGPSAQIYQELMLYFHKHKIKHHTLSATAYCTHLRNPSSAHLLHTGKIYWNFWPCRRKILSYIHVYFLKLKVEKSVNRKMSLPKLSVSNWLCSFQYLTGCAIIRFYFIRHIS
jgi:hypothetical protein